MGYCVRDGPRGLGEHLVDSVEVIKHVDDDSSDNDVDDGTGQNDLFGVHVPAVGGSKVG